MHVVAYGENEWRGVKGEWTVHAEDNALRALPSMPKKKYLRPINLVVIKTSKTMCYSQSKPCVHCVLLLHLKLPEKGYRLNRIYFTNRDGGITDVKLSDLVFDEHPYTSMYYKSNEFVVRGKK